MLCIASRGKNYMKWSLNIVSSCSKLLCAIVVVELKADYERRQVVMRHLGKKPSATSSRELSQGDTVCLVNGDALWLLRDNYKHVVKFCDVNSSRHESAAVTGRKHCADDIGITAEPPSKRHSSASTAYGERHSDVCDKDSDEEQVEMVCEISFCY